MRSTTMPLFVATLLATLMAWPSAKSTAAAEYDAEPDAETQADAFAGLTVRDPSFGFRLIEARAGNVPKVGEQAPDFTLRTADGKREVTLSSLRGERPVVLIFGSHT